MAKPKKETPEFSAKAMDVVFDAEKRTFYLITVGYDAKTKEAAVLKKEVLADNNKALALHKAKELLVKKIFGIE
jgi:hypothetical protein